MVRWAADQAGTCAQPLHIDDITVGLRCCSGPGCAECYEHDGYEPNQSGCVMRAPFWSDLGIQNGMGL